MSKYCGRIGFACTVEDPAESGIWVEKIVERTYYGEVNRNARRWSNPGKVNEDIDISNELSILSDAYAYQNLSNIRYLTWMGNKWKVSNIDIQYPRLNLTIGGLYNGEQD